MACQKRNELLAPASCKTAPSLDDGVYAGDSTALGLNQTVVFLKKDADAAKKAATDAENVPIHLVLQMCDRDPIQVGRR